MTEASTLPLPLDDLPAQMRRFVDPAAPMPARLMAARGLVPLKGNDQVFMLVQLAASSDEQVSQTARDSIAKMPPAALVAAASADLHPAILDGLAGHFFGTTEVTEAIVTNGKTADATIERIARTADERLCELIATNEERLLNAPRIIEALYKNKHARMSTADRLVELAARNGVNLEGVATFKAHVEALQGQLVPAEPLEEPLPEDRDFQNALAEDEDDPEAVQIDAVDGTEQLKDKFKPLSMKIKEMNTAQKLRLTLVGNAAARAILVRDSNKVVQHAAIASPTMTEAEAVGIAFSKEVSEDVLRFIGNNRREWLRNYELKRALIFNPKTPVGIALSFLTHLRESDLKTLARSRNVGSAIKAAAAQRIAKKENKKG